MKDQSGGTLALCVRAATSVPVKPCRRESETWTAHAVSGPGMLTPQMATAGIWRGHGTALAFFSVEENGTLRKEKKKKDAQVVGGSFGREVTCDPCYPVPATFRDQRRQWQDCTRTSPHIESTHGVSWKCLSRLPGCDTKPQCNV